MHFDKLARFNGALENSERERESSRVPIDFVRFYFQITWTGNPAGNSSHFSRRPVVIIQGGSRVSASYLSRSFPIRHELRISPAYLAFAPPYARLPGNFSRSKLPARKSYRRACYSGVWGAKRSRTNFARGVAPRGRLKFLFRIPDTHRCRCRLDFPRIPAYRNTTIRLRKLPLPGLHFAVKFCSLARGKRGRVSPGGWLFVERRHFLLTRDCTYLGQYDRRASCIRIGDIDSRSPVPGIRTFIWMKKKGGSIFARSPVGCVRERSLVRRPESQCNSVCGFGRLLPETARATCN